MKKRDLTAMSSEDLVALFADRCVQQGDFLIVDDTRRSNRLIHKIWDIGKELRARGPQARLKLRSLLDRENALARMHAAASIIGLVPQEGRAVLQKIREARVQPEALHTGMMVRKFYSSEWVAD